jgi:seryl-tRNA(Sec) selenium transferase
VVIRPAGAPAEAWERALRRHRPPVFCRIAEDRVIVDLRTLSSSDLPVLEAAFSAVLRSGSDVSVDP